MIERQYTLSRLRALTWLDGAGDASFTACLAAGIERSAAHNLLCTALDRGRLLDRLVEASGKSATGAAVFFIQGTAYLLKPPFPLRDSSLASGFYPGPLRAMLKPDHMLALVLVRLGHYAVGVFRGEELVEGKAGTGLVHARHHKGGSSSGRFARHREKQMEAFFTRVELHAREVIGPRLKDIDNVIYGGTRDTLQTLWRQCRFFDTLEPKNLGRLLTVRQPKRSAFPDAIAEAYSTGVMELREEIDDAGAGHN